MTEMAEEFNDDVENNNQPTIEELQAQLAQMEEQLTGARERIHELNTEGKNRRLKLKEIEQEKADSDAAAKEYQQRLQGTEETLEQLKARVEGTEKQAAVERAIADHGGIPDLLRPVLEKSAEVTDDGVVVGDKPVSDYVAELKKDERFQGAFRGRGQQGGGTRGAATGGQKPVPRMKRGEMNDNQKREFISSYGFDEYQKLPLS
ncbi:hypothetical protein QWY84_10660 [Aquisalimonas lutea]|uniref:hypothetical protein n=1 Tax=Aquisalimonas lutea TaxID=1327750 RepID=UPI0025B567EF|nr:hypothetical protein [Aquisalimonas lutea]MDN3518071.1 hypothetical protein [Aquisalimonas lutea]